LAKIGATPSQRRPFSIGEPENVIELVVLAVCVVAVIGLMAVALPVLGPAVRILEQIFLVCAVIVILFVMLFVGAEVVMRYVFNSPIPGHLEGSELLVPVIVFMAISYTQATHGHVGMDLLIESLSPENRRRANIVTLLASIFVCSVIAWFSFKSTYQLWLYDDVTMSPPYFKTWPASLAIPIGYLLCAIRMVIQMLNLIAPDKYPDYAPTLPEPDSISGSE
jgi:TRAP-type C4-dicarboxylate transport system permease small subunit